MKRDIKSLNLIIKYCDDVASDIARFGDDIEDLMSDASYQRSTAKSIELIGERAERLCSVADTYPDKTHIFRTRREMERYLRTIGARGSAYQPPNGCGIHEIRGRRSGVRESRDLEGGRHSRRLERGTQEVPGALQRGTAGLVRGRRADPIRLVIREENVFDEGANAPS